MNRVISLLIITCLVSFNLGCSSISSFHELHSEGRNDAKRMRYEWALESLLEAEEIDPTHKELLYDICNVYFYLGMYKESIAYGNRVLEQDSGYSKALKRISQSHRALQEYKLSNVTLEKLIALNENDYYAIYLIVKNYYDQKEYTEFKREMQRYRSALNNMNPLLISEKEKNKLRNIDNEIVAMESAMNINR